MRHWWIDSMLDRTPLAVPLAELAQIADGGDLSPGPADGTCRGHLRRVRLFLKKYT